jgi:dephospho-CoA kinase
MYIIGLTGGIGSGKSTAANILKDMGFKIIDLDQITHKVLKSGESGHKKISENFGRKYFDNEGNILRDKLKEDIFSSNDLKKRIELILHPIIFDECESELNNLTEEKYVVIVIPLLFETKNYLKLISQSLLIDCDEKLQLKRVVERDGISEAFARRIVTNQMSRKDKIKLADKVILNNSNFGNLRDQLENYYKVLLKEKNSA